MYLRNALMRNMWWIIVSLTVLIHLLALVFIWRYTTALPLAIDEWIHIVPRTELALEGKMTFYDWVRAKGEVDAPAIIHIHSLAVILPNVLLFNWNLRISAFVNYILICINTVLLLALLTNEHRKLFPLLLLPVTALMLAVQQRWNLLVSIHHAIHFRIMFTLLVLWFISRPSKKTWHVLVACSMAFLGSLSSLVSWMVWLILGLALGMLKYRRWSHYLLWGGGVVITAFVLSQVPGFLESPGDNYSVGSAETDLLTSIIGYTLFVVAYLGGVFNFGENGHLGIALIMGMFGLGLYIINLLYLWPFSEYRRHITLCTLLMLYSGIYGSATAIGRLHQFGITWATTHHYMSFGALYWVGLAGITALALSIAVQQPTSPKLVIMINSIVITLAVVSYSYAVTQQFRLAERYEQETAVKAENCIRRVAQSEHDTEGCLVVGGIATTDMIDILYEYRLTDFSN